MKLTRNRWVCSNIVRRFTILLTACLLAINLLTPFSLLLINKASAAGLGDGNTIVICTAEGFKSITLDSDESEKAAIDLASCCDSFCPLCQLSQDFSLAVPSTEYVLEYPIVNAAPEIVAQHQSVPPDAQWRPSQGRAPPYSS